MYTKFSLISAVVKWNHAELTPSVKKDTGSGAVLFGDNFKKSLIKTKRLCVPIVG